MFNNTTKVTKSSNIPIHRAMALSFFICLIFVLSVIWEINNSLSDVAENSEQIELETSQSEQDVNALTNKVFPAHRLELSVLNFLHEFEYMLIETTRDDNELLDTAAKLNTAILEMPPEATDNLSDESLNTFNETMGIFLDITAELFEIQNASERYQLLYDSKDSLDQFSPMLDQIRLSIEQQGKAAIELAKQSTHNAHDQVEIQKNNLQDMSFRASVLLVILIVVFLIANSGLYWTLSKRLSQVSGYTRELAKGNFNARIENVSSDSIGRVAKDVELMGGILAKQLLDAASNHEESKRRAWIDESMRELYETTRGASKITALTDAIALFIGNKLNLVAANIYYVNHQQQLLTVSSYGTTASENKDFAMNEGLPGLVASTGQIKVVDNVGESGLLVNSAFLSGQPTQVFIMPIMSEGVTKLVLELGATSQLSEQHRFFLDQASKPIALSIRAVEQKIISDKATKQLKHNAELLLQRSDELELAKNTAESASHSKSEFLANMSHEIRTPLNGIIGNTELLLSSELDRRQQGFTMTIQRSGDALLSIINDILDFSKIEAGMLDLVSIPFDLRDLIEDVGEMFSELAHEKNIELLYRLPPSLFLGAIGDPGRMRQVLTNLIGNALKFTSQGEVVIHIDAPNEDGYWLFKVTDTGIGISELDQQKIFSAFSQADGSSNRQFGGTGLGLAVSKQLVELMNGELSCSSTLGVGSTFSFTALLPVTDISDPKEYSSDKELEGLRVLIVDNNATNREVLNAQLAAWNISCRSASSADAALELLNDAVLTQAPYQLAILDQDMPEVDGSTLAGLIRDNADFNDMAIMMLSSVYQNTLTDLNISHSLMKPVRGKELYQCLRAITGKQTTFFTTMPAPLPQLANQQDSKVVSVLVVDDSSINRKLANDMLEQLGHHVVVVSGGLAALEQIENHSYDLILMDCQMPDMDGFEATRLIREKEFSLNRKSSYIAALTANAMNGDRQRCLDANMDDYLSKPYKQQDLARLLARYLSVQAPAIQIETRMNVSTSIKATDYGSVLDSNQLNEIRGLDDQNDDILSQLITLYLESSPVNFEALSIAIKNKDVSAIFHSAHALKSDSANLGAVELSLCCKELEELARADSVDGIEELFLELKRLFDAAQSALELEQRKAA